MTDEVPTFSLRPGAMMDGARLFRQPLLLQIASRRRATVVVMVARGAGETLTCRLDGATDTARVALEDGEPTIVPVPRGTRRIALEGTAEALGKVELGFFPVRGHFPLGRLLVKLQTFFRGRLDQYPDARGLMGRWRVASQLARHPGLKTAAMLATSPFQRGINEERYRHFRARWVEDFTEVPAAEAAPRVVFATVLKESGPEAETSLAALAPLAKALRRQNDAAFEWRLVVPTDRLARDRDAFTALVDGIGRLVPHEGGEADALNAALATGGGEEDEALFCLLDAEGQPTRDAVALIRSAFAAHPDLMLLYTDAERHDKNGLPLEGIFKPAFNRHLLESWPYFGSLTVTRLGRARTVGFDARFGPAATYDFLLRYLDGVPDDVVRHLPRIAHTGPDVPAGFRDGATAEAAAAAAALAAYLGTPVETTEGGRFLKPCFPRPEAAPLVSIVIPTRDRADLLGMTIRTLVAQTAYRNFEIIVVDNGSQEEETFALFREAQELWPATKIVRDDGDFNFPRICNAGVEAGSGELILLLNNDIEVIDGGWLDEMVALICRRDHSIRTGVVGSKLLYPDRTIQHGGVIVGLFGYASHWFAFCPPEAEGLEGRLLTRQDLTAVTGACLLIRKDVWEEIGPLDEERFAEDCNDIDLCMRARKAGYGVVWTPHALMIHHESASRGSKRSAEHRARLKAQHARFDALWGAENFLDPHFNPNLSRRNLFAVLGKRPEGTRGARTPDI